MDERHQNGEDSPRDHDASDPAASAVALGNQGAWNFKEDIAEKENSGAETYGAITETQVAGHLQSGGADVHAVKEGDDVQDEEEGKQAACGVAACALRDVLARGDHRRNGNNCVDLQPAICIFRDHLPGSPSSPGRSIAKTGMPGAGRNGSYLM